MNVEAGVNEDGTELVVTLKSTRQLTFGEVTKAFDYILKQLEPSLEPEEK